MFPSRLLRQCVDREVALHFKLHRGATDKLLEPLIGRIPIKQHRVDFFTVARTGDVAAVDPRADRSGDPLPIDALEVGNLRFIPARLRVCKGVVNPTLTDAAYDTMLFLVVVVAEGIDQQP